MRLVILESPYAGDVPANIEYARRCLRDCLKRGESPIASHLLFTQEGVLDDDVPGERKLGIDAGTAWYGVHGVAAVIYLDRGMSRGMASAEALAATLAKPIEYRFLSPGPTAAEIDASPSLYVHWERPPLVTATGNWIAELPSARLEVSRHRRPPTPAAPFMASPAGRQLAFYATVAEAKAGAEHYHRFIEASAKA